VSAERHLCRRAHARESRATARGGRADACTGRAAVPRLLRQQPIEFLGEEHSEYLALPEEQDGDDEEYDHDDQ